MAVKDQAIQMFSGLRAIIYLFTAILAFTATYPIYKVVIAFSMSNMAKYTIIICFWIIAFTAVYMGTKWAYQGQYGEHTNQEY